MSSIPTDVRDEDARPKRPWEKIQPLNERTYREMADRKTGPVHAIPTPWPAVNRMCMDEGGQVGLAHGWVSIIAAASSKGKTTCGLNVAVRAMQAGENVLYLALESSPEQVFTRLNAIASGSALKTISRGRYYSAEIEFEGLKALLDLPGKLFLNVLPIYAIEDICMSTIWFHVEHDVRMVVLDHMQLAEAGGTDDQIFSQVTAISRETRILTRTHGLVTVGLSQLNRLGSRNTKECPTKHDLQGGSTLENDADVVLMVDHCRKHYEYDPTTLTTNTEFILDKNRHGPTGTIPIVFNLNNGQVRERAYEDEQRDGW
jgi:replicative DNA helicase